jgi:hypothetical protein
MGENLTQTRQRRTTGSHELMPDPQLQLGHDDQVVFQQQVVVLVDTAEQGILDGQNGTIKLSPGHGLKGCLETGTGNDICLRIERMQGLFAVGTNFALECDPEPAG